MPHPRRRLRRIDYKSHEGFINVTRETLKGRNPPVSASRFGALMASLTLASRRRTLRSPGHMRMIPVVGQVQVG